MDPLGDPPKDLPVVLAVGVSASIIATLTSSLERRQLQTRVIAASLSKTVGHSLDAFTLCALASGHWGERTVRDAEEITALGPPHGS